MTREIRVKALLNTPSTKEENQRRNLPHFSDKVILPQSFLQEIVNQQYTLRVDELPHPLIVSLTTKDSKFTCFAGVKEFTADERQIIIPGLIAAKLGLPASYDEHAHGIEVDLVDNIEKGKQLTLRQSQLYPEINDWKWFLEAKLTKSYTTLTSGDLLTIEDMGKKYEFHIVDTSPKETICIVDTDISLEVEPLDDDMARSLLERRQNELLRETATSKIDLNDSITLTMSQDHQKKIELNITRLQQPIRVKLDSSGENLSFVDLVISTTPYVNEKSFIWSTYVNSSKEITIHPDSPYFSGNDEILYILPVVHIADEILTISVSVEEITKEYVSATVPLGEDEAMCSNCGAIVAKLSLFMHENFCLRNNIICKHGCGKIFLKKIPDTHWHCEECPEGQSFGDDDFSQVQHMKTVHTPLQCLNCDEDFMFPNLIQLALHSSTECSGLLHECRFCHLILPSEKPTPESIISGMSQHEYKCGSKTTECESCNKIIRLRDLISHQKLHELNRVHKSKPIKCSNYNCCSIIHGFDLSNPIGLCSVCYGPSYSSVLDPTGAKLKSRLERRYVLQLTKGCGNSWCKNQECQSSGLIPQELRSKGIAGMVPHVKEDLLPLIPSFTGVNSGEFCWFCVDLSMVKKKMVVDLLLEEGVYEREWICKAVNDVVINYETSELEGLNTLKEWLNRNGVKIIESS